MKMKSIAQVSPHWGDGRGDTIITLAKVFGVAGKDSGLAFVQGLAENIPDLSTLEPVEESAAGFKRFFSRVRSWTSEAFGNMGTYANQLTPIIQTLAGAIPIIDVMRKSTVLSTLATNAWTFSVNLLGKTFLGLPIIGWIAAIITILIVAWNKFEGFRKVVFQAWEVIKTFGTAIKDYVINRVTDLISGLGGLGRALLRLFKGDFKGAAAEAGVAVGKLMGTNATAELGAALKDGLEDALEEGGQKAAAYEERRKNGVSSEFAVNEYLTGNPEGLSYNNTDDDKNIKKGRKGKESGLSISGRTGGANIKLTINNYFNVSKNTNVRQLADIVAGRVADRLQDAIVTI